MFDDAAYYEQVEKPLSKVKTEMRLQYTWIAAIENK